MLLDRAAARDPPDRPVAGGPFAAVDRRPGSADQKILAAGLQGLGKGYVAEGKAAVETVTADVKELATVKSPTDFVQL